MPLRQWIEEASRAVGLDKVGIASLDALPGSADAGFFSEWLDRGHAGEMSYLTGERAAKRQDPRLLLAGAKSAICAALVYHGDAPLSTAPAEPGRGWISRYAWGSDYHDVLRQRLEALLTRLREHVTQPFEARVYVDTGPVLERALARQTPLGWLGKNTCLLNERLGSWFFLGEILTTLEIPPDEPATDRCGTCTRCLDACPTQAFVAPRVLDSTRCISYWTIEYKGEIPEDVRPGIGRHVFGCDICQDVCPWNRRAPLTSIGEFLPRPGLVNPSLDELEKLTPEQFRERFRNSPLRRLGYRRFMRNVEAAKKNVYFSTGRFSSVPQSSQEPS